jgi:hypothetical protein
LSQSLEAIEEIFKEVYEKFHDQQGYDRSTCRDSENRGELDCDSDNGEVDHDAETNEMVALENKALDMINP